MSLALTLRVLAARAHQTFGWAGWAGAALILISGAWLGLAWRAHTLPMPAAEAPTQTTSADGTPAATPVATVQLPHRSELPLLLTQVQQVVASNGLAWVAADYKVTAATETVPATLEVRSNLKGSYPQLRAVIAQMLRTVPGLTIRDLAMNRPNSDTVEVEAKLSLVVFLQDDGSSGERTALKGNP